MGRPNVTATPLMLDEKLTKALPYLLAQKDNLDLLDLRSHPKSCEPY
jgi:hypothetical protein